MAKLSQNALLGAAAVAFASGTASNIEDLSRPKQVSDKIIEVDNEGVSSGSVSYLMSSASRTDFYDVVSTFVDLEIEQLLTGTTSTSDKRQLLDEYITKKLERISNFLDV